MQAVNHVSEIEERDYDRWLVGIASIFFLISTVLILDDNLFRSSSKGVGPAVAQVSKVSNDVRRKAVGDLAFFPVRDLDALFQGDSVFTGADSVSLISFKTGSKITLNPETMVIIEGDGNNSSLNVAQGSLSATLGKGGGLLVNTGNGKTLLNGDNATLQLSKAADGSTQLTVDKGSILITGANGTTLVKENQSANLQGQKVSIEDHTFTLLAPAKGGALWAKSTESVVFKWQPHVNSKSYQVTISSDQNFKKVLARQTVGMPSAGVIAGGLPFREPLYWKVEDLTSKSVSYPQKFTLYRDDPPQLISPAQNKKLKMHDLAHSPISLEWQSWNDEKSYRVQVSKEINFSTFLYDREISQSHYDMIPLFFGNYYWRVKAINPDRPQSPWSGVRLIYVAPGMQLSAPEVPNRYLKYQIDEG